MGLEGSPGEHLYIADDPLEFAEDVIALLSRQRWDEFSESGRRFVIANFTWRRSAGKLEQILERLIDSRTANSVSA